MTEDTHWMQLALAQAQAAAQAGEVPVGAIVVKDGHCVASGHNQPLATNDPTAHAEIVALRAAAQALGNYRLDGCTLYVTLEPCAMCAGAMLHARLSRVVYGAADPKTGVAGSVTNLFALPALNHQTQVTGHVLADDCAHTLRAFFRPRRTNVHPLREDALRPPDKAFADLPPLPGTWCASAALAAAPGLRMVWLDSLAQPDSPQAPPAHRAWLALHDVPGWSQDWAAQLPQAPRLLVPDLPGCGRSDRLKKPPADPLVWQLAVLRDWLTLVDGQGLTLVLHDQVNFGTLLALALLAHEAPRFEAVHWMAAANLPSDPKPWADVPYPDKGHRAHARACEQQLPTLLSAETGQPAHPLLVHAANVLRAMNLPGLVPAASGASACPARRPLSALLRAWGVGTTRN